MKTESKRVKSLKLHMKQYWMLYAMLSPMVIFFLVFNYYPMLGLQLAFKDWNMRLGIWGSPWATTDGHLDLFKHFRVLFEDPKVTVKFLNTLRISSLKLLIGFPIPIVLTLLLNEMTSKSLK
ncbi:MAG: sugar ABC transporter permease, partial [Christensenellales bacterium]